jgi:hypothetical protein
MRQWIDVRTGEIEASAYLVHPFQVQCQFEAINSTSYPLTIHKIVTKVSIHANEWDIFTVNTNVIVPPIGNDRDNTYPFYFVLKSADIGTDWRKGTILTINGEISFEDCLRKSCIQDFGGLYACSANGFQYIKPLGIVPDQKKEREGQNPN